jgi:hypothetical protein
MVVNLGNESFTYGFLYINKTTLQTAFDHVFIYKFIDNSIPELK